MSEVLTRWNQLPSGEAEHDILPCCGSKAWVRRIVAGRPFANEASLLAASDETWRDLGEAEWMEAFRSHPRIGEAREERPSHPRSAAWSAEEQRKAASGGDVVKIALADANREYEARFHRIFIVCASGKSAGEILEILRGRLQNDAEAELREAAEQQRQIMQLRIRRWLAE